MRVKHFTVKGKRSVNEDYILSKQINSQSSIHLITDGMGGYDNGKIAAEAVANSIYEYIVQNINKSNYNKLIKNAVENANDNIATLVKKYNNKMGCTLGGIFIVNLTLYLFWVGDIKIIKYHNDKIDFESKDHSLINKLKENNSIPEDINLGKIRHIVTRSIQGKKDNFEADIYSKTFQSKDRIVICSDGILEKARIESFSKLDFNEKSIFDGFKKLFKENADNSSMIIIDF